MTAEEIRDALEECFPDVTDLEFNLAHSGFAHEHPEIAIGVVLISSIVLGSTDPARLAQHTRYSESFVRAVATNMENSGLWKDGKYDSSSWYRSDLIPQREDGGFWDDVLIGEGSLFRSEANPDLAQDSSLIFWQDKLT
jgi:hypothetical protein